MGHATAITPVLRYRDADTAARWLCEAFGFHEHNRAQELGGRVRYVSLRLGDSFVLVRPVANSVLDELMVQPEAIGGANTQTCYLTISDASAHRARAEAAGAKIEVEPQDDGLGGRFYTCRDLEGHLWSFGTRTYGATPDGASAFEPVEMSPSLPSTKITDPQAYVARSRWLQLLREIAISAATAVLVTGGWVYFDAGAALREMAAAPTVMATRLDEAVAQLAKERGLRLAAEAASNQAAARLAEEHADAAQLRNAAQRAQAELADVRQQKDEALQALETSDRLSQKHALARERAEAEVAVAKDRFAAAEATLAQAAREATAKAQVQLAELQQANLGEKEELRAARTALLAATRTIEELRATQLEPMVPDSAGAIPENSPCALAVQGKIALGHKGPTTWPAANLDHLCRGAEASVEPGKCFEEIMRGRVNWGAGTTWATANALVLCSGTQSARRTLDCFKSKIASDQAWRIAIKQCRTGD